MFCNNILVLFLFLFQYPLSRRLWKASWLFFVRAFSGTLVFAPQSRRAKASLNVFKRQCLFELLELILSPSSHQRAPSACMLTFPSLMFSWYSWHCYPFKGRKCDKYYCVYLAPAVSTTPDLYTGCQFILAPHAGTCTRDELIVALQFIGSDSILHMHRTTTPAPRKRRHCLPTALTVFLLSASWCLRIQTRF